MEANIRVDAYHSMGKDLENRCADQQSGLCGIAFVYYCLKIKG
jgi:hypothetical protein